MPINGARQDNHHLPPKPIHKTGIESNYQRGEVRALVLWIRESRSIREADLPHNRELL
jgi:hypothetical protein